MFSKTSIIILSITIIGSNALAQEYSYSTKPIKKTKITNTNEYSPGKRLFTGDILPNKEYEFNEINNYSKKILKWSDLDEKKLIILDFWSKYCTSCIASFPHMEKLQNEFKNKIQILLVTKDSRKELEFLFKNSKNVINSNLPMIFNDTLFSSAYFPHTSVPFHVWIGSGKKVIATTFSHETTYESIKLYLEGKDPRLTIRNDHVDRGFPEEYPNEKNSILSFDRGRLINNIIYYSQIPDEIEINKLPKYKSSVISKQLPTLPQYSTFLTIDPGFKGVGTGGGQRRYLRSNTNEIMGISLYNVGISTLIDTAYSELLAQLDQYIAESSISIQIDSTAKNFYEIFNTNTQPAKFMMNNTFSYESCMTNYTNKKAKSIMRLDIERCFGLKAKLESKSYSHIQIKITDTSKLKKLFSDHKSNAEAASYNDESKSYFENYMWGAFVESIRGANRTNTSPIIEDKTGITFTNKINITFPNLNLEITDDNIPYLNKHFKKYGLLFQSEKRVSKFLVVYSDLN